MSGGLGEALRELAERLPERVRAAPLAIEVFAGGHWHAVWARLKADRGWQHNPVGMWALEYALREECEARRWNWYARACPYARGPYEYNVVAGRDFVAQGDTPALALALALLGALRGQE